MAGLHEIQLALYVFQESVRIFHRFTSPTVAESGDIVLRFFGLNAFLVV